MKLKQMNAAALAAAVILGSGATEAALHDRGSGLLYDDVLDVTWLQDANYSKTSGYDADGLMSWNAARSWADTLLYHDTVRNVDYADWRLAQNEPLNGAVFIEEPSFDGSTDVGFNINSPKSELAYMYFVNLGLKAFFSPSGTYQPDFGIFSDGTLDGQTDVGLVRNLQPLAYWSGTSYRNGNLYAWYFYTEDGFQCSGYQGDELYAWAVRSGDVAAVPELEIYATLLVGLGLMGTVSRRKTKWRS